MLVGAFNTPWYQFHFHPRPPARPHQDRATSELLHNTNIDHVLHAYILQPVYFVHPIPGVYACIGLAVFLCTWVDLRPL
jgi:hypothetical protein